MHTKKTTINKTWVKATLSDNNLSYLHVYTCRISLPSSLRCTLTVKRVQQRLSLSVKCKCRFTSIFPDKPFGKKASLYCSSRRRGTFLKENTLNRRQTISFLSSARLCHALIHLFMHNIMHVDPPALATTPRHDYVIPADSPSNTCCLWS